MKWRHWSILIIMVLLNYIIFSTAFNIMAEQRRSKTTVVRTPQPTFQATLANPVAWIVLPTHTPPPPTDPRPSSPTPVAVMVAAEATPAVAALTAQDAAPPAAEPTAEPESALAGSTTHRIKSGETLSEIAATYGVSMQAIVQVNGLDNPSRIVTGQDLIIPQSDSGSQDAAPAATSVVQPTTAPAAITAAPPTATPTSRPPPTARPPATKPPPPTPARSAYQFTGQFLWDPMVAPNCAGPAVSKLSVIQDRNGNPVDGVRVEADCYGNKWQSHPSGNPGEYEPGHYDFSFGQSVPQDWTCTMRVLDIHGQPVESSAVLTIQFDTNDCKPYGTGHQVIIVNWTKNW